MRANEVVVWFMCTVYRARSLYTLSAFIHNHRRDFAIIINFRAELRAIAMFIIITETRVYRSKDDVHRNLKRKAKHSTLLYYRYFKE